MRYECLNNNTFVQLFYVLIKPDYEVGYFDFLKVNEELKKYSSNISGVPHYVVGDWKTRFTF